MSNHFTFVLNGKEKKVVSSPTKTLLNYLRANNYVGTKEGCAEGDCGACSVVVIAKNANGKPQYQVVNSCLLPLGSVAHKSIITVEGLTNIKGKLHPIQQKMVDLGGSQCGYCTPGFIMSMFAAYYTGEQESSLEGNLCRCTGYIPIRKALNFLPTPSQNDIFLVKLNQATVQDTEFNHPKFFRPTSLNKVFELLKKYNKAQIIAGGTDIVLSTYQKHLADLLWISIEAIPKLKVITETKNYYLLGAGTTLSHLETELVNKSPILGTVLRHFAARQIRNRATLGGNLATASPVGDLSVALLALDADLVLESLNNKRVVPISKFFLGYRQTTLKPNELITQIIIPKILPLGTAKNFSQAYKVSKRAVEDISTVSACFNIVVDDSNTIIKARLAYGGIAATPVRATNVEQLLVGKLWNKQTVMDAKQVLSSTFSPLSDLRGSSKYRNMLVGNLFEKFFVSL